MNEKATNSTSSNRSRFSVSSLLSGNSNNNSKKMPAKAPIYLKAGYKDGKKLREILSTEMISRPLGDVRHTTHVGRGADDVFGDVTFLTEKEIDLASAAAASVATTTNPNTSAPSGGETSMGQQQQAMMTSQSCGDVTQGDIATLRRNGEKLGGKKKKKSLKHLSQNEVDISTSCEELTSQSTSVNNNSQLSNVMTSSSANNVTSSTSQQQQQCDNVSIFEGWGLDLGPTIMDDVMRIMDKVEQL